MTSVLEEGKSAEELRRERELRVSDTIHLKPTDRIPVGCSMGCFVAKYAGIPTSAAYYDYDVWMDALRRVLDNFRPDMLFMQPFSSGRAMEYLDPQFSKWPGHGVPDGGWVQSIEMEGLGEDEYDYLLTKPADYMLRKHLPRAYGGLRVLSMLPELDSTGWFEPWAAQRLAMFVSDPAVAEAMQDLLAAGREFRQWTEKSMEFETILRDYGIPSGHQGGIIPPFDVVSHAIRGMKGTMLDMYRQPDKLLALCDFILERSLQRPVPPPNEYGNTRIFMTNTRGSDNFMSNKQFETFYWPTAKKLILSLIERGATPCIFFEGDFDLKLEYLLELPKASISVRLDRTDIFRAKEILGGHLCLEGNVPVSLLQMGSVEDVKDHCKKLIDVVGKDGGFILSPRSSTDEVKPENLKAMIDFTKEYGRY